MQVGQCFDFLRTKTQILYDHLKAVHETYGPFRIVSIEQDDIVAAFPVDEGAFGVCVEGINHDGEYLYVFDKVLDVPFMHFRLQK